MASEFQTIGMMGRTLDPRISETMIALAGFLARQGRRVLAESSIVLDFGDARVELLDAEALVAACDLVIAVGGDGTLLHASRPAAATGVPVLGVNRGRLGFLADVTPDRMLEIMGQILEGQYVREERQMLQAHLHTDSGSASAVALNDVVVQRWDTGRMLDFETWIDGVFVNTHGGDGLVVATATGSTAYALSCGGPILQPDLDAIVLAPICPHTLSDRPIVVGAASRIEIRMLARPEARAQVTCDGLTLGPIEPGQSVSIASAGRRAILIHPQGYDYYRILRSKLHWGRGGANRNPAGE